MNPSIKSSLGALRLRLALVAIITGRSARQARDILGLYDLVYVGNHGLERLEAENVTIAEEARPFMSSLEQLVTRLRARFPSTGFFFEDKDASFAVHYRHVEDHEKALEDLLESIGDLAAVGQVRVLMGKTVVNVLPPVDLNKGTAVASLIREYGLSGAILIGDDVTDLDSFRAASSLSGYEGFRSLSVAVVGPDSPPELENEADFTLSSVSEVQEFLDWLVDQTG